MNRSFMFLKAAFALAAMVVAFLACGASIDTDTTKPSNDIGVESPSSVLPDHTLFRELSAVRRSATALPAPGEIRAIILAATGDPEEDEESADEEAAAEKDDGFEGPDRLGNAPKLG
ncbi:MAG: hypothetical protein HY914_14910 [Desulfomonile tiedjei]|nr:hypothetical protein [Desulfomonile tiedjei]